MTHQPTSSGLEPVSAVEPLTRATKPRTVRTALRMTVRGRSVRLRGLRLPPSGLWRWLAIPGPWPNRKLRGSDAGGIATYKLHRRAIWLRTHLGDVDHHFALCFAGDVCPAGAATGRVLLDLIRERFGVGWAVLLLSCPYRQQGPDCQRVCRSARRSNFWDSTSFL